MEKWKDKQAEMEAKEKRDGARDGGKGGSVAEV